MLVRPCQCVECQFPRFWTLSAVGGLTALAIVLCGFDVRSRAAGPQPPAAGQPPAPTPPPQGPFGVPPRPPQPPGGMMPPMMGMSGGPMTNRLGAYLERPSETLTEQLDLPKDQGLVLERVLPGSAADKAGFKSHDILLELNGKAVPNNPWQLNNQLRALKPDQKIDAVVMRKGHKKTIKEFSLPEAQFGGMPGMPGMGPPGGTNTMMQQMMRMQRMQHMGPPGMPQSGGPPGMMMPGRRAMNSVTAVATSSNGIMTTLFKTNDHFTARHQEGNLIITVDGKTPGGNADVKEITVQDGQRVDTYKSLDKVPARYRDKVNNLMDLSAGNNAKIQVTPPSGAKPTEAGPLQRSEKK